MWRYLTAGESHGKAEISILEGCPANLTISEDEINKELARRQAGYGRGERMKIEADKAEILSGVRNGKTIGSPISISIINKSTEFFDKAITQIRPGHADLPGALKYNQSDIRNILERASARETASRVALGAIAKMLLREFKISINSRVLDIGGKTSEADQKKAIDQAKKDGDTVGGVFEVTATGLPPGLGSHVQWDRRLTGMLAQAIFSIPAIKGVEFGQGFEVALLPGSKVHDALSYKAGQGFTRQTNNAGGLEGGMTNGEPLVLRAAVKPIATMIKPLDSVDLASKKPAKALVERSDICAVEPAAVIGEAVVALTLAGAMVEKFGGDNLADMLAAIKHYKTRIS